MVNKFHYVVGGSETYYFALKNLLEAHGHEVIEFSMQDDRNLPSKYSRYFVKNADYHNTRGLEKVRLGMNIIYSFEAKRKFERLVLDTRPDLVHLHLFQHQISESILDIIRKHHIPAVYTAHELKMLCPDYKMYTHGRICEKCKGGKYYNCVKYKCIKDSTLKSVLCMTEAYFHMWRHSYDVIDRIITPSEFYRRKFISFGICPEWVTAIPNFLDRPVPEVGKRQDFEEYYLYFGRLSAEKGIMTLIKAAGHTGVKLLIVGRGDEEERIRVYIRQHDLNNISLLGFKNGQELNDIVGNAKAVVLPSQWYENGPYSAIEALQMGRPVIGSDIGGIPELIDGNGFTFRAGSVKELSKCIRRMENLSNEQYRKMKERSIEIFNSRYTPKYHYARLMKVYKEALQKNDLREGKKRF